MISGLIGKYVFNEAQEGKKVQSLTQTAFKMPGKSEPLRNPRFKCKILRRQE